MNRIKLPSGRKTIIDDIVDSYWENEATGVYLCVSRKDGTYYTFKGDDAKVLDAALEATEPTKPNEAADMPSNRYPKHLDSCECGSLKPLAQGYCWDCWARKFPDFHSGPQPKPKPAGLAWTAERPTVPGWYWMRRSKAGYPVIDRITESHIQWTTCDSPTEWAGPIPEPGERA